MIHTLSLSLTHTHTHKELYSSSNNQSSDSGRGLCASVRFTVLALRNPSLNPAYLFAIPEDVEDELCSY